MNPDHVVWRRLTDAAYAYQKKPENGWWSGDDFYRALAHLSTLNPDDCTASAMILSDFHAEVMNGGLLQWFWKDHAKEAAPYILKYLDRILLECTVIHEQFITKVRAIIVEAYAINRKHESYGDLRAGRYLEESDPDFGDLDIRYYAVADRFCEAVECWLKDAHKEQACIKA